MRVYRVKDKATGEYHHNRTRTSRKTGRVWTNIGHVKLHLQANKPRGSDFDNEDFKVWLNKFIIEEYELEETKINEYPAGELWQDLRNQD